MRRQYALLLVMLTLTISGERLGAVQARAADKKAATAEQVKKAAVDLSGSWTLTATLKGPPGMPDGGFQLRITLKQRGTTLEGHSTSPSGIGAAFTGTVKNGKEISFTVRRKNPTDPAVIDNADFTGTIADEKTIKGYVKSWSKGPGTDMAGEGPYVATRR